MSTQDYFYAANTGLFFHAKEDQQRNGGKSGVLPFRKRDLSIGVGVHVDDHSLQNLINKFNIKQMKYIDSSIDRILLPLGGMKVHYIMLRNTHAYEQCI